MAVNRVHEISENLARVRARISNAALKAGRSADEITLIVVTKTYPLSDLEILYDLGVRDFGENRIHEGAEKAARNFSGVRWHFQGQIQSNKIPTLIQWADVIHSLDDIRHAVKINQRATKNISVFLQVSLDRHNRDSQTFFDTQQDIEKEFSPASGRGGVAPEELADLAMKIGELPHLSLAGIMAVAPLAEEPTVAFARLHEIYQRFTMVFPTSRFLSAGMSNDFEQAIAYGATHIRVGSSILGLRS